MPSIRWTAALAFAALFAAGPDHTVRFPASASGPPSKDARQAIRYDRDIRPILADRCFQCHGPDAAKRQAELRLDTFEGATKPRTGRPAVAPGRPDQSELWLRVTSADAEVRMPPAASNKKALSRAEQELVRRWIEDGAPYEPHWSFVPPRRPAIAATQRTDWAENPIDAFVLAALEAQGLSPSADADRETLARRLFLDVTGLPPTLEEQDAFAADFRPDALERWLDRLFREEPYRSRHAERMTMPWLDQARYADTCGIHMDAGRSIWPWRDWVLQAYRHNLPFDRFVREQLAGDLLPGATQDQRVASGFNRNHVTTDEGGAIAEEYLVEYAVERASTTGSVFLGLTLGCARCHEHKFDPVSQDEFYSFYAFFNSIEEPGLYSQLPDAKRAFEPSMPVPSPEQAAEQARLKAETDTARAALDAVDPAEEGQRAAFLAGAGERYGIRWAEASSTAATSSGGATLAIQPDGSVLASGANPARDDHTITLRTGARDLRILALEVLPDPSLPAGRIGRAPNGNAVLSGVELDVRAATDATRQERVPLIWAWADHEQPDGDFQAVNVLDTGDDAGWAVDAHRKEGGRLLLLVAKRAFGFDGGTELRVRLQYQSIYDQHSLGRVRIGVGTLGPDGLAALPPSSGGWHLAGPFLIADRERAYEAVFGPESDTHLDKRRNFGFGNQAWRHDPALADGRVNRLPDGVNVSYVAKRIHAASARRLKVSLGSDDGFQLLVNGEGVGSRRIDRAAMPDQDEAAFDLEAGENVVVFKIVNTGGLGGFYWRAHPEPGALAGDLALALAPPGARTPAFEQRLTRAWRLAFAPAYRERAERIAALEKSAAELDRRIPRTMVMQERAQARPAYVLDRGQYDRPIKTRAVARDVPAALGAWPAGAPRDRLGLAEWLLAPENPLFARVAVNRLWEMVFGQGLVRTSEDFGMQGEWPSHPELLDWLAVEFRECGWDVQHMLRLMITSRTWRQQSKARPDAAAIDPDNRLLAFASRRRLGAEMLRDQALFVAGLLVEHLGGPSVKPYQPDGLWQEVAMPQSNTRVYERGMGEDLWRRSLYTYWKRACPPPSMLALDAPTRESCTIRRPTTNTPLQALVLWNDLQFVEAARVLAQRGLAEPGDDTSRLVALVRRGLGRRPDSEELASLGTLLLEMRARFSTDPEAASALIAVGESPKPSATSPEVAAELAAWTLVASAVLSLDAALCRS